MTPSRLLWPLAAMFLAVLGARSHAEPPTVDPSIGRVEVIAELPSAPPYVGEPILLKVRSSVRANVALDHMRQPALTDFDWQQFGVDTAIDEMVDGFRVPVIERVLAVFPLKPGRLTIEAFVRHVTIVTGSGERVEADFASRPFTIDVRAHDGVGHADDWWLPAKSVQIADKWEPSPDKIGFGETARRTLTVEAAGVTADRLPPPPTLKAPGVIAFAGPVERQTIVTDDGPIARAVYRWNVRPMSNTPAILPAVHIPWFDIATRQMRDATTPEREIAFIDASGERRRAAGTTPRPGIFSTWPFVAGAASFMWTMAIVFLMSSRSGSRRLLELPPKAIRDLRRAARRNDLPAFRRAVEELSRIAPDRWRGVAAHADVGAGLAAIDAAMFGAQARQAPALAPLASAIASGWRNAAIARPQPIENRNTRRSERASRV